VNVDAITTPARFPWNGGPRWLKLSCVTPIFAKAFTSLARTLEHLETAIRPSPQISPGLTSALKKTAGVLIEQFGILQLTQTSIYARRLERELDSLSGDEIAERVRLLTERMNDELDSITLLWVSPREFQYFEKTELFGANFKKHFPVANAEVIEAGNCFALGRYTACVFHLMRATEKGILALYAELKLPPLNQPTWSWGSVLKQIGEEIKSRNTTLATDPIWHAEKEFYEQTHAFLHAAKNPIRNSTMHVAVSYDEAGAENVFNAIKAFLSHVATRLRERP
jgi:hypothetical protein